VACSLRIYFFNASDQMDLFRGFQMNMKNLEQRPYPPSIPIPDVNTEADSESPPNPRVGLVDLPNEILPTSWSS